MKNLFLSLTTAVFFLLSLSSAQAKPLPSLQKIEKASDYFMTQLTQGEFEAAYSLMSAYIGFDMERFLEKGKKAEATLKSLEQKAGKPLSYALLKKESVDGHFYKLSYLLKYQNAALVWELNYYQPEKGWNLVDISFHGNINELFK